MQITAGTAYLNIPRPIKNTSTCNSKSKSCLMCHFEGFIFLFHYDNHKSIIKLPIVNEFVAKRQPIDILPALTI